MVQRYDYFSESEEFEPFDRGDWVKYEDYERLKQEFMDYVVIKEKEIAYLNAMLAVADDDR